MQKILDLVDEQLGRILFVFALVWCGLFAYRNQKPAPELPALEAMPDPQKVKVELDMGKLATASPEQYFLAEGLQTQYRGGDRFVFVPPQKKFVFQPVTLEIYLPGIKEPPMLLPSNGPSLEGSDGFVRWGKELPEIVKQEEALKVNR